MLSVGADLQSELLQPGPSLYPSLSPMFVIGVYFLIFKEGGGIYHQEDIFFLYNHQGLYWQQIEEAL